MVSRSIKFMKNLKENLLKKPLSVWMILKYLKGGGRFVTWTSGFGALGIIVGVACLMLAMSIMNGVEHVIKQSVIDINGHFIIYGNITKKEEDIIKSSVPELKHTSPFITMEALAINKGEIGGILVNGLDKNTYKSTLNLDERIIAGEFLFSKNNQSQAMIGSVLSEKLNLNVGDKFQIVVPRTKDSVMEGSFAPQSKDFYVSGILDLGKYDYNERIVFIEDSAAQEMLGLGHVYSGIKLLLNDADVAVNLEYRLQEKLGFEYHMQNWFNMNYNFFSSLELEKWAVFVILSFIILVACFNVCSTLFIYVIKRFYDISILKTLGASDRFLIKLFISQGLLIGVIGSFGGLVLGFILCMMVKHLQIIEVPANIYQFSGLPVDVEIFDVFIIVLSTLLICFVSTILPAIKGAKLDPVEGFRT